jgi:hypothetical protein
MSLLLKITLVPVVVWLASLAGRRWGHSVSGWISGLPLIAGPLSMFLAAGEGAAFAAETAATTLQATAAAGGHCLVFGLAARRGSRWPAALVAGWLAFVAVAALLGAVALPPAAALVLNGVLLALQLRALPAPPGPAAPVPIPPLEIGVRIAAAMAFAAAIVLGSSVLGPRLSGILLTFPIVGSVLPAFTLALYGPQATQRLLRGFLRGLYAFAAFHFVVATALPAMPGVLAYALAVGAAVVTTAVLARLA